VVDIFDEVDEELRADRARDFLRRYGGLIVAGAVLIVTAVGGWKLWGWYDARQAAAVAAMYIAAERNSVASGQTAPDAQAQMAEFAKVAESGRRGYRTAARLQEAALAAKAGDIDKASALWDELASDRSADTVLRDLASLLWATHHLDQAEAAAGRLQTLLAPTNPWHALATEADAWLALKRGAKAEAETKLRSLAQDVSAPEGVRARATDLLARLSG
jgi:hypothetical protein